MIWVGRNGKHQTDIAFLFRNGFIMQCTHILVDKVTGPCCIKGLDPLYGARGGVHDRRARCVTSGHHLVVPDIIRTDPERVHGLFRSEVKPVCGVVKKCRQLVLNDGRECSRSDKQGGL